MSVKILHIADLHLGRKFSFLDEDKAKIRYAEALLTLKDTIERFTDAKLVIISGDIFEEDCPLSAVDFVVNLFSGYTDKFFALACGNHDPYESKPIKYLMQKLPSNAHVFLDSMDKIELREMGVEIHGVSFCAPHCYTSLLSDFRAPDNGNIQIMAMHADISPDSPYNPISKAEISKSNLDYLALGHVHSFSGINNIDGVFCAYPGVLEPGGFDEAGSCGVIYGEVAKEYCQLEFYSTSKREHTILEVDISNMQSEEELIEKIKASVCKDNLYKVILYGTRNYFLPNPKLYSELFDCFYIEFEDKSTCYDNILNYTEEMSLRGKTALAMLKLKNTCNDEVFEEACSILTELMCR